MLYTSQLFSTELGVGSSSARAFVSSSATIKSRPEFDESSPD